MFTKNITEHHFYQYIESFRKMNIKKFADSLMHISLLCCTRAAEFGQNENLVTFLVIKEFKTIHPVEFLPWISSLQCSYQIFSPLFSCLSNKALNCTIQPCVEFIIELSTTCSCTAETAVPNVVRHFRTAVLKCRTNRLACAHQRAALH
jgi:hypothetical protein